MLTFWLQWVMGAAIAAVAALSLVAARLPGADPHYQVAWRVTGLAFAIFAADLITQLAFGSLAMARGPASAVMAGYVRLIPLFNHSRTFLMFGAVAALVVMALRRVPPGPRFAGWMAGLLVAGTVVGATLGFVEGGWVASIHLAAVAIWDVVELLVLLATLFVLLVTDRVDRYLWALLAVYASQVALGILWFTVLAQLGVGDGWAPSLPALTTTRVVLYAAMAAMAWRRIAAGRRGAPVHGMFGPPSSRLSVLR